MGCGASTQLKRLQEEINTLRAQNEELATAKATLEADYEEQAVDLEELEKAEQELTAALKTKEGQLRYEQLKSMVTMELVAAEEVNVRLHSRRVTAMKAELATRGNYRRAKWEEAEGASDGEATPRAGAAGRSSSGNPLAAALGASALPGVGTGAYNVALDHLTEDIVAARAPLERACQAREAKAAAAAAAAAAAGKARGGGGGPAAAGAAAGAGPAAAGAGAAAGLLRAQAFKGALRDGCPGLTRNEAELVMLRFLEDDDLHVDWRRALRYFEERHADFCRRGLIRRRYSAEEEAAAFERAYAAWLGRRGPLRDALAAALAEAAAAGHAPAKGAGGEGGEVLGTLDFEAAWAGGVAAAAEEGAQGGRKARAAAAAAGGGGGGGPEGEALYALSQRFFRGEDMAGGVDVARLLAALEERKAKFDSNVGVGLKVAQAATKLKRRASEAKVKETERRKSQTEENLKKLAGGAMVMTKLKKKADEAKDRVSRRNEERMINIVRSFVGKAPELEAFFKQRDAAGAGRVPEAAFSEKLQLENPDLTPASLAWLADQFEPPGKPEEVDYRRFIAALVYREQAIVALKDLGVGSQVEVQLNEGGGGRGSDSGGDSGSQQGDSGEGQAEVQGPAGDEEEWVPATVVEVLRNEMFRVALAPRAAVAVAGEEGAGGDGAGAPPPTGQELEVSVLRLRLPQGAPAPAPAAAPAKKKGGGWGGCCGKSSAQAVRSPEEIEQASKDFKEMDQVMDQKTDRPTSKTGGGNDDDNTKPNDENETDSLEEKSDDDDSMGSVLESGRKGLENDSEPEDGGGRGGDQQQH